MTQKLAIRQAAQEDLPKLWGIIQTLGYAKDSGYFEHCLERQAKGDLLLLIAAFEGVDAGYAVLNWMPKYGLYRKLEIPEVQDLNILNTFRRRGFATEIIRYCEDLARAKGRDQMGIAVSVHSSYGPAQRLYFKLGYEPDGLGVTYDRGPVEFASLKPVDDQLCLMLVKGL